MCAGEVANEPTPRYTPGMKTAISIPDPLFKKADKLAKKRKISRSELYRQALAAYVKKEEEAALVEWIERSCDEEDASLDAFRREAARRIMRNTEW